MEGVQTRSRTKAANLRREQSPETSHDEGDEGESESEWSYDFDSDGNEVSESDQGGCDESDEQGGDVARCC